MRARRWIGWVACMALGFVLSGCGDRTSNKELTQEHYVERLRSEGYLGPTDTVRMFTPEEFAACMKQEGLIGPDSLWTSDVRRRAAALYDVLFHSVVVRENCWWLTCNRQTLVDRGVPAIYYDLLVYNCWSMSEATNRWIAEGRITPEQGNMERAFEEFKALIISFGFDTDEAVDTEADAQLLNEKASETP